MPYHDELRHEPSHEQCHEIRTSKTVNIVAFTRVYVKREGQHLGQSKQQL